MCTTSTFSPSRLTRTLLPTRRTTVSSGVQLAAASARRVASTSTTSPRSFAHRSGRTRTPSKLPSSWERSFATDRHCRSAIDSGVARPSDESVDDSV